MFCLTHLSSKHCSQQLAVNGLSGADPSVGEEEGSNQAEDGVGDGHGAVDGQVEGDVGGVTRCVDGGR